MFWRWARLSKCCLQDVVFLRIARSSDLSCSLNLSYTKQKSMENYAVRLSSTVCDSSTTIADNVTSMYCAGVRYSLTPSNRENWGGLSRSKFTVSFIIIIRSIAVQLSDNISDIWSSLVLYRGEIEIIQVFDEGVSSLAIAKKVKIMLLPKPVDKISMTSLLWRKL